MHTTPLMRLLLVLVASLVAWGLGPSLAVAQSTVPRPSLSLNAPSFRPGETLRLSATVTPGSTPVRVDAYVAVELPDGRRLFLQGNRSFTDIPRPIVAGFTPAPFTGEIFSYTFTGTEPVGHYKWLAAFTTAGTGQILGEIVAAPFTFVVVNTPPVPDAGEDHFVRLGRTVTLNGSGSTDPDGDVLTYGWTFLTVPTGSRVTEASLVPAATVDKPTFTPDVVGQYQLRLTVDDGHGATASAEVMVNAQVPDEISSACNCEGKPGEIVALLVRVTDADGNPVPNWPVRFTLEEGDGDFVDAPALSRHVRAARLPARQGVPGVRAALASRPTVTLPTDNDGTATARLQLGEAPVHIATARAQDVPDTVVFIVGFVHLTDIAVETDGHLVVLDAGLAVVLRVDPATGNRTVVSGRGRGNGPPLARPLGLAVDARHGSLLVAGKVTDVFGGKPSVVLRVDPSTGKRTVVSGVNPDDPQALPIGSGPLFERLQDIAVGANGTLWVVDGADGLGLLAVLRVDPATGRRTVVSGIDPDTGTLRGSGPRFFFPRDIAVVADGSLVVGGEFTSDTGAPFPAVVRVHPETGDRTIVTTPQEGAVAANRCPSLYYPDGIAAETAGTLIVLDNSLGFGASAVLQVDPTIPAPQDNCTIVSRGPTPDDPDGIGNGEGFVSPTGVAVERDGNLVVVDKLLNAVVRVERGNGNRTIVARGASFGEGRPLLDPGPIAVETPGTLLVVDNHDTTVVRVDPHTGDRTVVSGCPRLGCDTSERIGDSVPPFVIFFRDIAVADHTLIGVGEVTTSGSFDPVFPAVMRVNLRDGTRSVFSGCPAVNRQCLAGSFGSGPPLELPTGIAVANGYLVVSEGQSFSGPGLQAVVQVDATGNRRVLSGVDPVTGQLRGSGPRFVDPLGIAVEDETSLVVVDGTLAAVLRVDAAGNRRVLSGVDPDTGQLRGSGPRFSFPSAIAVEDSDSLLVVSTLVDFEAVVRVNRHSGDRTIVSSTPFTRNLPVGEVAALTYWHSADGKDIFLLADRDTTLYRLTNGGEATLVGFMGHVSKGLAWSADAVPVLYSISPDDSTLRGVDPTNALTVSAVTVTVHGAPITGGHGLATHPQTGTLWALLALDGSNRLVLATINPTTGVATAVGNTGDMFAGLAFDASGILYGVTDDAIAPTTPDKSLFTLNTADATPTCILALGRGDGGETMAFNPVDTLLYHAAGELRPMFESVALEQPHTCATPATTTDIPLTFGGRGLGPPFVDPRRLAVEASGQLVLVDGTNGLRAVVRVHPMTGDRTIVSR